MATGSTSRYPSSPSRLPALLAAYRKYGSLALGSFVSREPLLQERGRGGEREERQADGAGERAKQPPPRIGTAGLADLNRHRQRDARDDQHAHVDRPLPPSRHTRAQRVGVDISQQQHGLEEDDAGAPYRRAAAEDGKQNLPRERLHHEEQRRGEKNREREEPSHACGSFSANDSGCGLLPRALGVDAGELGAEQQDLARVVHPQQQDHHRSGGAVAGGHAALAEIQADELLTDREEHRGHERAGRDIAPAQAHVGQETDRAGRTAPSSPRATRAC